MGAGREPLTPLDAALQQVRRVFCRAKRPKHLKNRMDFLQKREEARLLGRPREDLTAEDLCDYVSECGGKLEHPELAYFMPRICEVLAAGESTHPALGWVCALNCLKYSNFPAAWPDDQAEALQGFVGALLLDYVATPERFPDARNLGEMLWMAGTGGLDVPRLTVALGGADEHRLACALAIWIEDDCFVSGHSDRDHPHIWRVPISAAWATGQAFAPPVLDWLVAMKPWRLIGEAAKRETNPEMRASLRLVAAYCAAWPEAQAASE